MSEVMAEKEIRRLMRTPCARCGNTFAIHAAEPPHVRGGECDAGFTATPETMVKVREWQVYRALRTRNQVAQSTRDDGFVKGAQGPERRQ